MPILINILTYDRYINIIITNVNISSLVKSHYYIEAEGINVNETKPGNSKGNDV